MMNKKLFASIVLAGAMMVGTGCGRNYSVPPLADNDTWGTDGTTVSLPTGTIQGRVVDTLNGLGIADVRVEVVGVNPARFATTDNSGNFVINEVPSAKVKLSLDKQGYTYNTSNGDVIADVMAGSTITTPEIELTRDADAQPNSFVTAFGNVESPRGLSIDANSNTLYAVSRYDSKIKDLTFGLVRPWGVAKFNLNGGFQGSFGVEKVGILSLQYLDNPQGMTVDRGGNVMVVDQGREKVFQYSSIGNFIRPATNAENFAGLDTPSDIAVLRTGQFVVANAGNNEVLMYNVDGSRTRDQYGNVAKPLMTGSTGIKGIAVDAADCIYVIDNGGAAGSVIKKYDASGKLLLQFGYLGGRGAGYFEKPSDLAIDNRNGDIYVVDGGNNRVQRFNNDGAFLSEFGGMGPANGQFNNPSGIAVDKEGFVYVADSGNHRIQKFAPSKIIR